LSAQYNSLPERKNSFREAILYDDYRDFSVYSFGIFYQRFSESKNTMLKGALFLPKGRTVPTQDQIKTHFVKTILVVLCGQYDPTHPGTAE
jgi:hypothetical protein